MPKIVAVQALDHVFDLIAAQPGGLTLDELAQQFAAVHGSALSRRTLQRRLAELGAQQRIQSVQDGRSVKFQPRQAAPSPAATPVPELEALIPLTPEGAAVLTYTRLPRQQRRPVGYQIRFLEAYQPNHSAYLPEPLRAQLHSLGQASPEPTPAGTFARDILNRLLIDLAWASSRLEGNTYTRLDTERLIEFGQAAEGKDALETQMILNHKSAIEFLVCDTEHAGLNPATVIALHAFLSDGLMPDPQSCGRLRRRPVEIGGSVYLPLAMPQRLQELFDIVLHMAAEINDPFEQSFFLMVHLPYLQPFEDVNKRVSRLAANIPLIRSNLCPLSFVDVPPSTYIHAMLGVYECNDVALLRDVFVWAYERSCQSYLAVQQQLAPPDTFRLRYRHELAQAVCALVRGNWAVTPATLNAHLPPTVPAEDQTRFVALVQTEFQTLHAGNAIRFGLRPLEFAAWQQTKDGL